MDYRNRKPNLAMISSVLEHILSKSHVVYLKTTALRYL